MPRVSLTALVAAIAFAAAAAPAELYINEIYFDPPGGGDSINEYIELRGAPGMSLADHYLVFLESESSAAGTVDNIFDLGAFSIGSNGFMTIRQKNNQYTPERVDPDANHYVNDGPNLPPFGTSPGFGNGAASTVGHSDVGGEGIIENGAFSALLVRNVSGAPPVLGEDLDVGDDGLDVPTGKAGWELLDSIAIAEEDDTLTARFYAQVNFASRPLGGIPGGFVPKIEPGAEFEILPYEIEYIGRWGNSVGQTLADWHVSNLSDDNRTGYQNADDFRQSGAHPANDGDINTPAPQPAIVETNQGVPYGTILITVGSPNFRTGDFNKDGVVDAADYSVWRDTEGDLGTELAHPPADPNHDFVVDGDDYDLWVANYGEPTGAQPTPGACVPEPTTGVLITFGLLARLARRR